jgi:hypothetical protein
LAVYCRRQGIVGNLQNALEAFETISLQNNGAIITRQCAVYAVLLVVTEFHCLKL